MEGSGGRASSTCTEKARGALARWRKYQLSRAFVTWSEACAEIRQFSRIVDLGVRRFLHLQVYSSWRAWRWQCSEMLNAVIKHMQSRTISRAWKKLKAEAEQLKVFHTRIREKVDVAKLRGKVVLIYFCASWCPPCVHEYPNLKSVYDRYHKKGFEIVGISADKTRAQFDLYSKRKKIPWPQHYEDNAWEGSFMKQFRVEYIPRLFLLDHTGRVAAQDTRKNLEEKVRELLAKRPSG